MKALLALRNGPNYRRDQFAAGLVKCGYEVVDRLPRIDRTDLLVTWNRHGARNTEALRFVAAGAKIFVAENGPLGKIWNGRKWFSIARDHHNGAGSWTNYGPERWDSWGVEMQPFRAHGREVIVLAQRGIGEPGIGSPAMWAEKTAEKIPGSRIRRHPGRDETVVPLEEDLRDARCVVTWHSAAALRALMLGVPVFYDFPKWLGRSAGKSLNALLAGEPPRRDESARLDAMRNIAWAMWTDSEVENGAAFEALAQ